MHASLSSLVASSAECRCQQRLDSMVCSCWSPIFGWKCWMCVDVEPFPIEARRKALVARLARGADDCYSPLYCWCHHCWPLMHSRWHSQRSNFMPHRGRYAVVRSQSQSNRPPDGYSHLRYHHPTPLSDSYRNANEADASLCGDYDSP